MPKVIGFCCTTAQKEPIQPILENICDRLHGSSDYRMVIYHCFEDLFHDDKNNRGAASVFDLINFDMLDVMVIAATSILNKDVVARIINRCERRGVPVITIDEPHEGVSCISFDYGEAFSKIVEHILEKHGARRIKVMAGWKDNEFSQTRINSCAEVMSHFGLTLTPNDILYGDFWDQPTYKAMDEFFASGEPLPEAFICCNDIMAIAVCNKLREHGYNIPQDVIVTGFDGIELEKYHSPRLTTAVRDNRALAQSLFEMIERLTAGAQPYSVALPYTPVFSESCCCKEDTHDVCRRLIDFVQSHTTGRLFEEEMNNMSHVIAAEPTMEHAREVLRQKAFDNTVICITEELYNGMRSEFGDGRISAADGSYPDTMHVFMSKYYDGRNYDDVVFPTSELLPDFERSFGEYNAIFIMPLHFQDSIAGYYMTHYAAMEHYNEFLYTFSSYLNSCIETMNMHERLTGLNRKMEFLFTHDQLTGICNRYGFYNSFKQNFADFEGKARDVYILSIDLNDMKYINDNFGHSGGDEALVITARALNAAAASDARVICSRFGGDEFVVARICSGDAKQQSESYHSRFTAALAELNGSSGKPFAVEASVGVYSADLTDVDSVDRLIELADRLMYNDKARYKRHPRN
ncbi:MAG: diguanylate cyclase domain-containing protein [Oscillospiraceae bacterium]